MSLIYPVMTYLSSHFIARTADQGFANILGLDTLRHGTNPLSWVFIHLLGTLPIMGDRWFGGDADRGYDNAGKSYFTKDAKHFAVNTFPIHIPNLLKPIVNSLLANSVSRLYAGSSTFNLMSFGLINKYVPHNNPLKIAADVILGLFLINIKFRFPPEVASTKFKDDWTVTGVENAVACSTESWVGPWNIGIVGTVWHSLTYKTALRIFADRRKLATGISQLTFSALAVYRFKHLLLNHPTSTIAGAVLGLI